MIASQHGEMTASVGIAALLNILHPGTIHADGDVMLFLARHRARMAADTTVLIDDKSVAHSRPFYSENSTIAFESFTQLAGKIGRGQLKCKK
jgi:hypothetical protein